MKTHSITSSAAPRQGIKSIALAGALTAMLGMPSAAWSGPTLLSDSYVSTPFAGGKHGIDSSLKINASNTGFLKFTLSASLPTEVSYVDIDKATLKIYLADVISAGNLTVRRVNQSWKEETIPVGGISPLLDTGAGAKTFKISKSYAAHWIELDVTRIVKGWVAFPKSDNGFALTVENGNLLDMLIDSKENTATGHQALLDVVLNKTIGATGATGPQGPIGAKGEKGINGLTTSVNGVTQIGGAITLTKANFADLNSVDNTSDAGKPISTATQNALALKANLASPSFSGTPLAPTAVAGANTSQLATTAFVANALAGLIHAVGDVYGGGTVFYVYDGGLHGLIAAPVDQSTGVVWGGSTSTRARADGLGAGKANTAIIIANSGDFGGNAYAAMLCNEYSVTVAGVTYADWYLPSKAELTLLHDQKAAGVVEGFADNFYWSSTEFDEFWAWPVYFGTVIIPATFNKQSPKHVRAIRAF